MSFLKRFFHTEDTGEEGLSKIQKLKILRDETGEDLKTCHDALEYSHWELPGARDYIKYGW